jgi:hypothetical protein
MSVPAEKVSSLPEKKPTPMMCLVVGRLIQQRRIATNQGARVLSLVAIPSSDPYTSPQVVELESTQKIAEKDDDITVVCRVGGYRRSFKYTDKETGEVRDVVTADNRLTVVE